MREVLWVAGADNELQEIFNMLEERREGRGLEFMNAIENELAWLRDFPESWPQALAPFRQRRVPDTFYGIFYTSEAGGLIVHALLDLRQDPRAIYRRLFGRDYPEPAP
jgi:plasmid stabilization system protein ParE